MRHLKVEQDVLLIGRPGQNPGKIPVTVRSVVTTQQHGITYLCEHKKDRHMWSTYRIEELEPLPGKQFEWENS